MNKPVGSLHMGLKGEYRYVLHNVQDDGSLRIHRETDWEDNLITNLGLAQMTEVAWYSRCITGTSAVAPDVTDTSMVGSFLAASSSVSSPSTVNLGSPTYACQQVNVYRFNQGVTTGTIQEIGLSNLATGANICSHYLPSAPIVVAANQVLDIYFRFTVYPELADWTGTATIGGVDYDVVMRYFGIATARGTLVQFSPSTFYSYWYTTDGPLGLITSGGPTGNALQNLVYGDWGPVGWVVLNTTYYRDMFAKYGLTKNNHSPGAWLRCSAGVFSPIAPFQCQFTATNGPDIGEGIPKDYTKELTLTYRATWGRH